MVQTEREDILNNMHLLAVDKVCIIWVMWLFITRCIVTEDLQQTCLEHAVNTNTVWVYIMEINKLQTGNGPG